MSLPMLVTCTMYFFQDFPSVYQVRQRLIENDIITIFAVAEKYHQKCIRSLHCELQSHVHVCVMCMCESCMHDDCCTHVCALVSSVGRASI